MRWLPGFVKEIFISSPPEEKSSKYEKPIDIDYGESFYDVSAANDHSPPPSPPRRRIKLEEMHFDETEVYFVGSMDSEGRPHEKGKLVSSTKGFVDGLWHEGTLIELYACELISSENENEQVFYVRKQRDGFLFTCDNENFVARVEIDLGRLPQDDELNLDTLSRRLISLVQVQAILEDGIYHTIQQTLDGISKMLGPKSGNTATSLTSAEDFYQISLVLKAHHNSNAIVKSCLRNEFISQDLKTAIKIFELETENYQRRNQHLLKIQGMPETGDVQATLMRFLKEAMHNHNAFLIRELPRNPVDLSAFMTTSFERLEPRQWLFMDKSDIFVFNELASFNQLPYIKALWSNLVLKVNKSSSATSLDSVKPLTSSVFPFIFKSFIETTNEICERSDLEEKELFEVNDRGNLQLRKKINWRELSSLTATLEQQYRFLHKLLEHFAPGNYSKKRAFDYEMKMVVEVYQTGYKTVRHDKKPWYAKDSMANKKIQIARIHNDRLRIWLCLIDSIFNGLLEFFKRKSGETFNKKLEVRFLEIAGSLIKVFAHFLEDKGDQNHESCRTTAINFIRLARNLTVDQLKSGDGTLEKQLQKISQMIEEQDEESFSNDFANLMAVYSEFWERQELINCMEVRFAKENAQFQVPMTDVREGLRKLLDLAMGKQVTVNIQVQHLRSFNEFFRHFLDINFDWVVKKDDFPDEMDDGLVRIANEDKENYVVLKPIEFDKFLEDSDLPIPKHYKFDAIKKLGATAHKLLTRGDWVDEDILDCTNSLYFAIGYSFRHFQLQIDYEDFKNFLADSVCPFENIVARAETPNEFTKRIQNVENFFLYSRKMDEMSVEETIQKFEQEMAKAQTCGFQTTLFNETLKICIEKYLTEYTRHMETHNIDTIIEEVKEMSKAVKRLDFKDWTPNIKQDTIPSILAGLSAVWSIDASKDLEGTGNWLKPHLIQIICIFRLLSADRVEQGVINHLAQVLTGQGKSIILGLLSALLALCGFEVRIACYSKYLAGRDQQDFDPLFRKFGVLLNVSYGDFGDLVNETLKVDLYGGNHTDLRSLVAGVVENTLQVTRNFRNDALIGTPKRVLLIDEVDVFFSDSFYGETYNPGKSIGSPTFEKIQRVIWNAVTMRQVLTEEIVEEAMQIAENSAPNDDIVRAILHGAKAFLKKQIISMVQSAEIVNYHEFDMSRYRVDENGRITWKNEFGIFVLNLFMAYQNVFAYFRLKRQNFDSKNYHNFGYIMIACGHVSYAKLPLEYPLILGVTGTLTSISATEKEAVKSYNIDQISSIPTFFGRYKLNFDKFLHFKIEDSEHEWMRTIYESARDEIENKRAVLVFFKSEQEIKSFQNEFKENFARMNILTGNETKDRIKWIVNEAGVLQTLTLATRHMGRGTDFKSNDSRVEGNGGVHVIQTFFSEDVKEETQIKGRTARKDNKGSYELILCRDHLKTYGEARNYDALDAARRTKAEQVNREIAAKIASSDEKHTKTMNFLRSFANYDPRRRMDYIQEIEKFN